MLSLGNDAERVCSRCLASKPVTEFAMKNRVTESRSSYCRDCQRASSRAHYRRNTLSYLERARAQRQRHRRENHDLVMSYLAKHSCVDCGESDPVVLDFDHVDPASKSDNVSRLMSTASPGVLLREIVKCQVRCANCHRMRTAMQFSWGPRLARGEAAPQ